MALWNRNKGRALDLTPAINFRELVNTHDVVDVDVAAGIVVVAERPVELAETTYGPPDMRELGRTGATVYSHMASEEYNPKLRGHSGLRVMDEMRRSDGEARALLRLVKTPVLAARWFVEPASESAQDVEIGKFVLDALTKWQTVSWPQLLTEILLHLDYGYYSFEKVFTLRDGKVIWKKFAPRHPMNIEEWKYDANGGPNGMYFLNGGIDRVYIPIEKLAVFTNDKEAGNLEGIPILRPAYKHYYYKDNLYKIDAIQKERHGIGIPVIKLPPNFDDNDKRLAQEMGKNLRTNEKAHIVLPPMWEIMMLKLEGQPVDIMESINHHNHMMLHSVLGGFLDSDSEKVDENSMFLKATRYIADVVRDVFNKYCIPELVDYNWRSVDAYPELRVRRIGETVDWRTMSFAIRNFVGAGIIVPDDRLEDYMREELDVPRRDEATARVVATPQMAPQPARVGPPRQSAAGGMQQAQTAGSNGRVGNDQSGGN